jgi:hypothetical protein
VDRLLPSTSRPLPVVRHTAEPSLRATGCPIIKKNFCATALPCGRPQLLAAVIVNLILTRSGFTGEKIFGFLFSKAWLEIFLIDITLYFSDTCAAQNQKSERKSVTP